MRTIRSFVAILVTGASLLVAAPALAESLDQLKARGVVGERTDGFVGIVIAEPTEELERFVADLNARRAHEYEEIARRNDTTAVAVGALAGRRLVARAAPGHYVQTPDGDWMKKP